jgi:predicted hotdog family 3-hydroxylacyl-ACP dehydratase
MDKIIDLIPQRDPIVMVDEFIGIEGNVSKTRFTVYEENIFVDDNRLSECGLIEHIAQSAAARVGYVCKQNNQPIPIGYIGSVNNFELAEFPNVGENILTTIEIVQEVFNITLIKACCYIDDKEIASCKMKIFLSNNEAK